MNLEHPLAPEDLMAYLDGEAVDDDARRIQAHLATCGTCQQLAGELREGSRQMRTWQVTDPPPSLVLPEARRTLATQPLGVGIGSRAWSFVTGHRLLAGAAVAVLIVVVIVMQPTQDLTINLAGTAVEKAESIEDPSVQFNRPTALADRTQAAQRVGGRLPDVEVPTGPRIVRTATVRMIATDFDRVRQTVDRLLKAVGGFAEELTASDRSGTPRSIRGTLRVPSAQLDSALAALRGLGRVTDESHSTEDVTTAVVDLNVRLSNARLTERRLSEVLQNRTGRVADVLEVEREIARVRTEIEQMEAQRQQIDRRVEYATITLEVSEERAAAVDLGPVPIPTRLQLAIADGVESATMSMLEATLFVLRRGPALLLWISVLGLPLWWVIRKRLPRVAQRPGGV